VRRGARRSGCGGCRRRLSCAGGNHRGPRRSPFATGLSAAGRRLSRRSASSRLERLALARSGGGTSFGLGAGDRLPRGTQLGALGGERGPREISFPPGVRSPQLHLHVATVAARRRRARRRRRLSRLAPRSAPRRRRHRPRSAQGRRLAAATDAFLRIARQRTVQVHSPRVITPRRGLRPQNRFSTSLRCASAPGRRLDSTGQVTLPRSPLPCCASRARAGSSTPSPGDGRSSINPQRFRSISVTSVPRQRAHQPGSGGPSSSPWRSARFFSAARGRRTRGLHFGDEVLRPAPGPAGGLFPAARSVERLRSR